MQTKHTKEVGMTILEHCWFAFKIAFRLGLTSFLLFLHGLSGGLLKMPKKLSLLGTREYLDERIGPWGLR